MKIVKGMVYDKMMNGLGELRREMYRLQGDSVNIRVRSKVRRGMQNIFNPLWSYIWSLWYEEF